MELKEAKVEFRIQYKGPTFNDGTIDSKELASSIIAVRSLVNIANRELHAGKTLPDVQTRVNVPKHSSYDLPFQIVEWFIPGAMFLSEPINVNSIKSLLFGGDGVLNLLKSVAGRNVMATPDGKGKVEINVEGSKNVITCQSNNGITSSLIQRREGIGKTLLNLF